jgi:hypothetical protein
MSDAHTLRFADQHPILMRSHHSLPRIAASLGAIACAACGEDPTVVPNEPPISSPITMSVLGHGALVSRFTAEVWTHGGYAYTSTWGARVSQGVQATGNTVFVWTVTGATPQLVDSVLVPGAGTVGDVQVTDDGRYMVVCTELVPGSIVVYDLATPSKPRQIAVFTSPNITRGVHTAEVQRVNGRLYAFLTANSASTHPSRVVIVDLNDPARPAEVKFLDVTGTFNHDVFVRDGLLFTAQWNNGMIIFDIGGGGRGGTPQNPVQIGAIATMGGKVHNIWWFHDPSTGAKRYAFIGEEGSGSIGASSSGDIHVVDMSDRNRMREVAFFNVPGAGTHNFSVDEPNGFLYAAYYNAGVQILNIRGDLGSCSADQKSVDGRCDLRKMGRLKGTGLLDRGMPVYVWGVHFVGNAVYASDMLNGLWKLAPATR